MHFLDAYLLSYSILKELDALILKELETCKTLFDEHFVGFGEQPAMPKPLQPVSRPCSIEKYPSSQMANRYTRIFDAGGLPFEQLKARQRQKREGKGLQTLEFFTRDWETHLSILMVVPRPPVGPRFPDVWI